jgi:hypothetical protein
MSTWSKQELVDWVQARIDEVSPNDQSATIPQLMIERELDEAAMQVSRKAKKQLIYPAGKSLAKQFCIIRKAEKSDTDPTLVPYSVIIPLQTTFVRFLRVQLDNWRLPVDDLVSVDTNQYRHQFNRFQAATKGRPTSAIIPFSLTDGATIYNQAIELFPAPSVLTGYTSVAGSGESGIAAAVAAKGTKFTPIFNQTTPLVTDFLIVEKMAAELMPDSLIDPIVWLTAGRCLTNLRLSNEAVQANQQYQFVLDQLLVGMKGEEVPAGNGRQ